MATLETLRTKAGVFVSIIIGIALLAFIVNADTLATARAMFSSDDDMGKIAGTTVSREEFERLLNYNTEMYKLTVMLTRNQEPVMNDEVHDYLRNQTWHEFISKNMFEKQFKEIGLSVTDAELFELTLGNNVSPTVSQFFSSPETGEVDKAFLSNFVQNMDGNHKIFWINLEKQIGDQQLITKYSLLDTKSKYVNSIDIEHMIAGEQKNIEFSYLLKEYSTVADSVVFYKESDLKNYYNLNKEQYRQTRVRDAEFVTFNVTPSSSDYEKVMYKMEDLQKQMDTVSVAGMPLFVRINSDVPFDIFYHKQGQLPSVIDTVAFNKNPGSVLPFYQEGEAYKLSGIVEFKSVPDSVKAQHILLDQTNFQIADSLVDLINTGTSFELLAMLHSKDAGSRNLGGDLGWQDYDRNNFVRPFSDSCFLKPVGSVVKVATTHGIHIIKINEAKKYNNRVLLATVTKNIRPSTETYQSFFAQANNIAAKSQGDIEKFRAACIESGVTPQIETNIRLDGKAVGRFTNASNLKHWIYNAKEGNVSGVLEIEDRNTYVVAALTDIKKEGIAPFNKVKTQIAEKVIQQKKADYIIAEMTKELEGVSNIDDAATKIGRTVTSVTPAINFNTSYIPTLRAPEHKLLGAVVSAPENKLSAPLAGESGVYLYVVTKVEDNPQAQTPEAIKSRLEMESSYKNFYTTLIDKANIIDNRGKFY